MFYGKQMENEGKRNGKIPFLFAKGNEAQKTIYPIIFANFVNILVVVASNKASFLDWYSITKVKI